MEDEAWKEEYRKRADSLGDEDIDAPGWRAFLGKVKVEIERRTNEQND